MNASVLQNIRFPLGVSEQDHTFDVSLLHDVFVRILPSERSLQYVIYEHLSLPWLYKLKTRKAIT